MSKHQFKFISKANTLKSIKTLLKKSQIPSFLTIHHDLWLKNKDNCLRIITDSFSSKNLIIRSSSDGEDNINNSYAGFFESVSKVKSKKKSLIESAINKVFRSYKKNNSLKKKSEVIIQLMIENVSMSGVIFTKDINTGAPYYVVNYDDETGRTDTVTAGTDYNNRSLYIHRNSIKDLRSKRFIKLINAVKEIEKVTYSKNLDIEFATDFSNKVFIFQIGPITTSINWQKKPNDEINKQLTSIKGFLKKKIRKQDRVFGKKSIFGQMPDWNPVEMIGRTPKKLALSLYRYLITDEVWRKARSEMGYKVPVGMPLMITLSGVPYIDCRLSFNSFLPVDLPDKISEKLVNCWIRNLELNQQLHDKVEFEIIIGEYSFDFLDRVKKTIPNILTNKELLTFRNKCFNLTKSLILGKVASIDEQLKKIKILEAKRDSLNLKKNYNLNIITSLLEDCKYLGTTPFAILARHGFIAQSLIRSLVSKKIISVDEFDKFFSSIKTVAGEFIDDADKILDGRLTKKEFLIKYGHLRPGTYDIMSQRYDKIDNYFKKSKTNSNISRSRKFSFSQEIKEKTEKLLKKEKLDINVEDFFKYIAKATKAREYAKFVFSKNISEALECIEKFGKKNNLSKDELSHLPCNFFFDIQAENFSFNESFFIQKIIQQNKFQHQVASSIHLPHLICSQKDVTIIPLLLSRPNFITRKSITGRIVILKDDNKAIPSINNKIVVTERADPGFDWIFSKNIKGLVTKYGGSNSHMSIRCAEFQIPAAIGCGEQIFDRVIMAERIEIDCLSGIVQPVL